MLVYNPKTRLTPTELRQIEDAKLRRQRIAAKAFQPIEIPAVLAPERTIPVDTLPVDTSEEWAARQKRIWFRIVDEIDAPEGPKRPVRIIQRICAKHFQISMCQLMAQRRFQTIVDARQIAMYFVKMFTPHSLPEIGRRFGGKDHTTVLHAVRKIETRIDIDPAFATVIEGLRLQIEGAMQ